jgi:hypothetical protein
MESYLPDANYAIGTILRKTNSAQNNDPLYFINKRTAPENKY